MWVAIIIIFLMAFSFRWWLPFALWVAGIFLGGIFVNYLEDSLDMSAIASVWTYLFIVVMLSALIGLYVERMSKE